MTKTLIFVFALAASPLAHAQYQNAGQCADAVVNECNGKYEGGKALNACVKSGVNQCIKAYPETPTPATPSPGRGPDSIAATGPAAAELKCGDSVFTLSAGAGGACRVGRGTAACSNGGNRATVTCAAVR